MANANLVTGCNGIAHVTSADHGSLNAAFWGDGQYVLNRGQKFAISTHGGANNIFRIADGDLLMNGRHVRINPGAFAYVGVTMGQTGYNRNDLVVCRYTLNSTSGIEECNFIVIAGTATTGTATDPAYNNGSILNGDTTVDFPLYRVEIRDTTYTPVQLFTVISPYSDHLNQVAAEKPQYLSKSTYTVTEENNGDIISAAVGCTITLPDLPNGFVVKVFSSSGVVYIESTGSYICVPGATMGTSKGTISGAWGFATFTKCGTYWIAEGSYTPTQPTTT